MTITPDPERERCIVSTSWLAEHLQDPELRIFECTVYLRPDPTGAAPYRPEAGRADYEAGHIAGAGFIDLEGELSRHDTDLHFMRPSPEDFAAAMGRHGVGADSSVVLYSRGHIMWATRVWWMLRAYGFDNAAVLDGGWEKWQAERRPVATQSAPYPATTFVAKPRPALFVDREEMLASRDTPGLCTINALNPEFHTGTGPSRYGRPGRVPNSVNVPARGLIAEDNSFVSLDVAAAQFRAAGLEPGQRVITYCGGGISATVDNLMLHRLGYDDIATYDASMGEWARDESLPIETG